MTAAQEAPPLSAVGRSALERRVRELQSLAEQLEARAVAAEKDRDDYLANLTAVQARATQLVFAHRLEKHFAKRPADVDAFLALAEGLERARAKHPRGVNGIRTLTEELGEIARALRCESPQRLQEELVDLASATMRFLRGEVEPEGWTLAGWTCHGCGIFNGEEKERRESCRSCGGPR